MQRLTMKILFAGCLLAASGTALAHPGHDVSGLGAGLMHPFLGPDHLLAMVAVGIWAAQRGGNGIWMLPATFMAMLAAGAGLALYWQALPMVEAGIAASVLVLGLLVALSRRLPAWLALSITAIFGLLHGYAHGLELPASAQPLNYALGFLAATAALHLAGIAAGKRQAVVSKALGIAIAACGGYMLAIA